MKPSNKRQPSPYSRSTELGEFFKNKRLQAGLSSEMVASYLGISQEVLENYELGLSTIPLNHIYGLSNCLNISPDLIVKKLGE
jgi:transcriptional regulator with XRE-family HTH domain